MISEWDRCKHYIEAALVTCRTHNIDDIQTGISTKHYQFWPGANCAAVTEVCEYPRVRLLHHWLCGGDLRELLAQVNRIEAWAKGIGCAGIFGSSARPVLGRVLRSRGYVQGQIEYMKDLI
jgi:hypothetical protein